jgi:hypothetical protein
VLSIGSTIRSEIVGQDGNRLVVPTITSIIVQWAVTLGRLFAYLIVVVGNFMENSVIKLVIRLRQARVENCGPTDVF